MRSAENAHNAQERSLPGWTDQVQMVNGSDSGFAERVGITPNTLNTYEGYDTCGPTRACNPLGLTTTGRLPENSLSNQLPNACADDSTLGQGWVGSGSPKKNVDAFPAIETTTFPAIETTTGNAREHKAANKCEIVRQAETQKEVSPGIFLFTTKHENQAGNVVALHYEVESNDVPLNFTVDISGSDNMHFAGNENMKCITFVPVKTRTSVGKVELADKSRVSYSLQVGFALEQGVQFAPMPPDAKNADAEKAKDESSNDCTNNSEEINRQAETDDVVTKVAASTSECELEESNNEAVSSNTEKRALCLGEETSPSIFLLTTKHENQAGNVVALRYEVESNEVPLNFTVDISGSNNMHFAGNENMKCITFVPVKTRTSVGKVELADKSRVSYSLKVSFGLEKAVDGEASPHWGVLASD